MNIGQKVSRNFGCKRRNEFFKFGMGEGKGETTFFQNLRGKPKPYTLQTLIQPPLRPLQWLILKITPDSLRSLRTNETPSLLCVIQIVLTATNPPPGTLGISLFFNALISLSLFEPNDVRGWSYKLMPVLASVILSVHLSGAFLVFSPKRL